MACCWRPPPSEKVVLLTVDDPELRGGGEDQVIRVGTGLRPRPRGGAGAAATLAISRRRPELVAEVLACLGPIGRRWPRGARANLRARAFYLAGLLGTSSSAAGDPGASRSKPATAGRRRAVSTRNKRSRDLRVTITAQTLFGLDLGTRLDLATRTAPCWSSATRRGSPAPSWGAGERAACRPSRTSSGLNGLAARTGSSNFDVAEAVWLKLARELAAEAPTIAILCKTSVARRILQFAHRSRLPIADASIRRIDAARWFGAAVDACLFQVTLRSARERLCRSRSMRVWSAAPAEHACMGFARRLADRGSRGLCGVASSPTACVRGRGGRGSSTMPRR